MFYSALHTNSSLFIVFQNYKHPLVLSTLLCFGVPQLLRLKNIIILLSKRPTQFTARYKVVSADYSASANMGKV